MYNGNGMNYGCVHSGGASLASIVQLIGSQCRPTQLIVGVSCVQDGPYLLEPLADSFTAEDVRVRLALLTAGGQLFFKRPPETQASPRPHPLALPCALALVTMHQMPKLMFCTCWCCVLQALLGRLLSAGMADSHQDVHDRALLYYR
jgi:hypothetical protein